MPPNSLTLESCFQQALDIHPPWSVQKAELEQFRQRLRIDCSMPAPSLVRPVGRPRSGMTRAGARGGIWISSSIKPC